MSYVLCTVVITVLYSGQCTTVLDRADDVDAFWSEVFRRVLVSDAYKPKDWNKIAKVIPIFAIGIAIGIATTS